MALITHFRSSLSRVIRSSSRLTIRTTSDEGSIRDAGGKWKEKEMADENQYFRKLQAQQIKDLLEHHHEEVEILEDEIERLQKKLKKHKKKINKIKDD